jgi:DNA-binding NarL/FixJ family response regulator
LLSKTASLADDIGQEVKVVMFDRRLADHSLVRAPLNRGRYQTSTMRVIVIESRALLRTCMQHALAASLPESQVECVNFPDECSSTDAQLLLVGLDPRFDCGPAQLDNLFRVLRGGRADTPIGIYLHSDDPSAIAAVAKFDVAGILLPSSSLDLVIAAVRLMAVGGRFLPSEFLRAGAGDDTNIHAPATVSKHCSAPTLARPHEMSFDNSTDYFALTIARPIEMTPSKAILTIREEEVLKSLRAGRQNKIIAFELGISESTVKVHLRNIMKKLKVSNRTQAAMRIDETRMLAQQD